MNVRGEGVAGEGESVCDGFICYWSRQMDKVVHNRSDRSVTPVRPVLTESNSNFYNLCSNLCNFISLSFES